MLFAVGNLQLSFQKNCKFLFASHFLNARRRWVESALSRRYSSRWSYTWRRAIYAVE